MTTRLALRSLVRDELNDVAATKLWSDVLLNTWINEAIRDYSRELPREISATITVVANQDSYTLPGDLDHITRVEQPKDSLRYPIARSRTSAAGADQLVDFQDSVGRAGPVPGYRVFGGKIILDPKPTTAGADEDIRIEYLGRYAEPALDTDVITTPASDDDVLVALVAARAFTWISGDEAKRQRVERQRGASVVGMARTYQGRAEDVFRDRKRRVRTQTLEVV